MDRLQDANVGWRIYAPPKGDYEYGKAICPVFADCIYSREAEHQRLPDQVIDDATAGELPAFSIVVPYHNMSQHNGTSMLQGDNWIGSVVGAIMDGPGWKSTAVFITWDDCGCFYDHVPPPSPDLGIRVPMVIVSPYAKPGFTDSNTARVASMLAFTEHTFGLAPLSTADANAYDYSNAFDFSQPPLAPVQMHQHELPAAERAWLAAHPPPADST
jgi:phospholipase C